MENKNQSTFFCYWSAFIACLGGFIQSYVTCVIAGALLFISTEFNLSPLQEGNTASLILIGAILGSLSSAYLADRWGRKKILLVAAAIYFLTAISSSMISTLSSLLVLRFLKGFAVGLTSMIIPMYLAEIAPAAQRGAFVTGYQFSLTIGTLLAYFVNYVFAAEGNWRMMFFLAAIPAAIQILGLFFLPESPRWLLARKRVEEAKKELTRLTDSDFSDEELKVSTNEGVATESLFSRPFFLLVAIAVVLGAFQQLCGINAVIYFSPKIFKEAGFGDPKDAIFATFLVGIVNVIATFLTIVLIDRVGRRKLLLFSQSGVIVALCILIGAFATEIDFIDRISVVACLGYVFVYSLGLGPIVWVLISEIFPLSVRAKALALGTFISWSSNYLVVLLFPFLSSSLGTAWTFGIFLLFSLFALGFFSLYIPETKGKSLEELERLLVHRDQK